MNISFRLCCTVIMCIFILTSCKKSNEDLFDPPIEETSPTPVGSPVGTAVKKIIDSKGGQLTSPDGTIRIDVPAGALETAKEISIQPITNQLPGGIGNAYRLLPHGEQFKKPVTIVFNYRETDVMGTIAEFLDVAYQSESGEWQALTTAAVDKSARKISVNTTHFSDWTFFKSLELSPMEASVELGGNVDLKVTTRFPYIDPDDLPADQAPVKVLKEPRELRAHEIKGWSYAGDGILISRASEAFYTAPDHEPDANPEAVTANIKIARKGQFMLVSNITVLAGHNVRYLNVDEDYKRQGNDGSCKLYMYGSFGNDPGTGKRTVKINGNTVDVDLWAPTVIRCKIDREIFGAVEIINNNKTVARSVLRRYSGSFLYERFQGGKTNSRSTNPLKETTEFKIVYRGFGAPVPSGLKLIFESGAIAAFGTRADYKLGGAAAVTTPGSCPTTTSVSLPEASGTLLLNTISPSADTRLKCLVKDVAGGIEIKMEFRVVDVITGVRVQRTTCNYTSLDPAKPLDVSFEGFNSKPILLAFTETAGLVLKDKTEIKTENFSSDILIEAWDGTGSPSHYVTDGLMPATLKNK